MSPNTKSATPAVFLCVDRDGWTNGIQVSIDLEAPDGSGRGYRLSGPKYNGSSSRVARVALSERDANEIRSYLDSAFPRQEQGK